MNKCFDWKYIHTSILIFTVIFTIISCGGGGDGIVPTSTITPGKWFGDADFGNIEFEVTPNSSGIGSCEVTFLDFICGTITHGGSITVTSTPAHPIVNGNIDFDISLGGPMDPDYIAIEGTFEASGDYISGNFELDNGTAVCSGTWVAQPNIDNDGDGYTESEGDCDDDDSSVNPGASEICNDVIDNDCDGDVDGNDSECGANITCCKCRCQFCTVTVTGGNFGPDCTDECVDACYRNPSCGVYILSYPCD